MRSDFVFAILVVLVAVGGVKYLENDGVLETANKVSAETPTLAAAVPDVQNSSYFNSSEVRIVRGAHNQFFVNADINRNAASFLVDTGASYVALRESDALASGIYTKIDDYVHAVRTANGETKAHLSLYVLSKLTIFAWIM